MPRKNNRLFRYTNLPILIDILSKQELTLLNPASWDDRNDSYYIELYKSRKRFKTLAICFTTKSETYHHWKVFSDGSAGVCIQFNKNYLLEDLEMTRGVEGDYVSYVQLRNLRSDPPSLEELPFLKRYPYKDEAEYRVIYKTKSKEVETKAIHFEMECIERITLSPWLPGSVAESVKDFIRGISSCSKLRISKTTLVENSVWKNIATKEHGITKPSIGRSS